MDVIEKLKILKKNSLYAEFLHKYPSSYILKKNKKLINIESINSNNNLLYIHIPFCLYVCDFCSVNKTKLLDYNLVLSYLKTLYEEIDHYSKIVKGNIS
jgi:coproporphyrinogen III oxidase-like Fe-S oxidoreductase